MKMFNSISAAIFAGALMVLPAVSQAQNDSSANAPEGFTNTVRASTGVVVRVPIDAQGRENGTNAELRVTTGAAPTQENIKAAFDGGTSTANVPRLNSDPNSDSSTWWGNYGWNNYCYNGWYQPYYYSYNYSPYYYYNNNYWNYNYSGYYYNYYYPYAYNGYNYYGYRYYYYNSYW